MISANPVNGSGPAPSEHDAKLVIRFNAGDEKAFEEIVHRYRAAINGMVYNLLRNHEDAEEVTSDTFIRAHRGLAKFRGDSALSTWLYKIAANLARNRYWYWWRRKRDKSISIHAPIDAENTTTLADAIPGEVESPLDQADLSEVVRIVADGMEELNDSHREILILRNVQHLHYNEIAEILSTNVGTVKSRLSRARRALHKEIFRTSRKEIAI